MIPEKRIANNDKLFRKRILGLMGLLLIAFMLDACTMVMDLQATVTPSETIMPSSTPRPTYTVTPTDTPLPSITPTETPTPTHTSEIPGLISRFGLNTERQYTIQILGENRYLVDQYNQAKMLRWENEGWVDTTLEEKYGQLLNGAEGVQVFEGSHIGDMFHVNDARFKRVDINVVFTGDVKEVNWNDPETGREIRDYRGMVVYRDGDGSIKKFWASMFLPDVGSGLVGFRYRWDLGGSLEMYSPEEALGMYTPGQVWNLAIVYDRPIGVRIPVQCYDNGYCTDVYNSMMAMGDELSETIKVFGESWLDDDKETTIVPEGLVVFPDTLHVWTDSDPFNP